MQFCTTKEISEKWGISTRQVSFLCKNGFVDGAEKRNNKWRIPCDAEKPIVRKGTSLSRYEKAELKFKVIYPENKSATYTSLLNYSDDLNKPYQRWYRYKEGFSIDLVQHLIREYSKNGAGVILDPFMGSGSTLLAAAELGYDGVGYEVNPFSYFLSKCKLDSYSKQEADDFKKTYEDILTKAENEAEEIEYNVPELTFSAKVFDKEVEKFYMVTDVLIGRVKQKKTQNLLKLGWLACLESLSNYRKAGNGLKFRKYVKPRVLSSKDAKAALEEEYKNIYTDISDNRSVTESRIFNKSCLDMASDVKESSVEGIIFSPPYANCFDYTEIYKLELWYGKFVSSYAELKQLRKRSLHSHLNGDLSCNVASKSELLDELIAELETKELWDKKIPRMLRLYYDDMFRVIDNCCCVLKNGGFCCIVIGNSAYGGVIFPADLILADYAEKIGFRVDKIEVDRYIITSSQQYNITKESGKYLRESVVCLTKDK